MQNDLYAASKARMGAPDDASFLIRDGNGCVMFSAPHCVKQWREGREKFAEPETGVLAEMLPLLLALLSLSFFDGLTFWQSLLIVMAMSLVFMYMALSSRRSAWRKWKKERK